MCVNSVYTYVWMYIIMCVNSVCFCVEVVVLQAYLRCIIWTVLGPKPKPKNHLFILASEWTSRDWCAHVTVCVCVCITWFLFDRQ